MSPIRTYREKHGLTLQQFATLIGVKKAAVCKYENGVEPSVRTAQAIDEATSGEVPKWALRPDVWEAPVSLPEACA